MQHGRGRARENRGDSNNGNSDCNGDQGTETESKPAGTQERQQSRGKYCGGGCGKNKSADKTSEWSREETEESASEEEVDTAEGAGEARRPLTAAIGEYEESGVKDDPGGSAAGGGATANTTSMAANKDGAGGCHGARSEVRERVASRRENLASEYSRVEGEGGAQGLRSSWLTTRSTGRRRPAVRPMEWRKPRGGERQGVGGGVESPQSIDTPGVEELLQWDKNPRVVTEGEGVTGEDV